MLIYDELLESCKFLPRNDLFALELASKWTRNLIQQNRIYWPLSRSYRLTFLEFYAITTLARVENLSNFAFQLGPSLQQKIDSLKIAENAQIPIFLDEHEPTFLLFEFSSGRKFYVELEPFLNAKNSGRFLFWIDQIANAFFEEEIRGLLDIRKFSPELVEMLELNGMGKMLHFQCKTFGCYEYEAFDRRSVEFVMGHLSIEKLDKANGTIFSPELMHFLFNGGEGCGAFSTRWVMGCGQTFTDELIQHALLSDCAHKMVPSIRFTPSSHRQRELPIPRQLIPSPNICLLKREIGDWKYEEWAIQNVKMEQIQFRVFLFIYDDLESGEEALSQFGIERA